MTDSTLSQPWTLVWKAVTADWSASSERKAWMVTVSSTLPTMLLIMTEPRTNRPMMKSERKMVTTAPRTVVQLRRKWWPHSLRE